MICWFLCTEVLEASLSFSFQVVRTKVILEFGDEHGIVGEPGCMLTGGESGFKPIECSSVEVQQHVGNFGTIIGKGIRLVVEVQETLGKEQLKFTGVRTIKLVWFPDSSLNGGFPRVIEAIGESAKGLGEVG